jgi:hypothetical protein
MTTETQPVFIGRVAAAARAAWWTLLVGVIIVLVQFLVYTAIAHVECLRHGIDWLMATEEGEAQAFILAFMMLIRVLLLVWLLICVFLSLWARGLRRTSAA